jgi:hypothetical protein
MGGSQSVLLERDAELAALAEATAAATAGGGMVVLAEGTAGIGKTTLIRAACTAVRDALVITARGFALEQDFPFGIVRQLFEPLRFSAPGNWDQLVDGAAGLAGRVFAGGDPGAVEDDLPYATVHGLYWLTANLAAIRPLIIAVDDAHWADAPSLRWLSHLAARIDGLPVTLLLAARTGSDQSALLDEIAAFPSCVRLELAPLGREATAALVRGRLGARADEDLCRACHVSTGGNPFLLQSLTSALHETPGRPIDLVDALGPRSVAQSVLRRVGQFGAGAVTLTRALAVLGGPAQLRQAAALAGLQVAEAALLADRLRAADVLAPGSTLEFAHPIVRTAVYESLPPGERALAHAGAALLLKQDGADPERVALHLLRTEPAADPSAVEALRAAAVAATGRGAPESAAEYLRRALAEPPEPATRAEVFLALGIALAEVRSPAATGTLHEAVAGSADNAAAALLSARVLGIWGYHDSAAAICREALDAGCPDPASAESLEAEFFANAWIVPATVAAAWTRAGDRLATADHPGWQAVGALAGTCRGEPPQVAMGRIGPLLASGLAGHRARLAGRRLRPAHADLERPA